MVDTSSPAGNLATYVAACHRFVIAVELQAKARSVCMVDGVDGLCHVTDQHAGRIVSVHRFDQRAASHIA